MESENSPVVSVEESEVPHDDERPPSIFQEAHEEAAEEFGQLQPQPVVLLPAKPKAKSVPKKRLPKEEAAKAARKIATETAISNETPDSS
eukprot:g23582.t1